MALGQQSGPPASTRQVDELLSLLREAGHADFRDARGPMKFTQRQAGGKFTRDEATELIDRLQVELDPGGPAPVTDRHVSVRQPILVGVSSEHLADELRRRGWCVIGP